MQAPQRIVTLQTATKEPPEQNPPSRPTPVKAPKIASVPIPGGNAAQYSIQLIEKARADAESVLKKLGSQLAGLSACGRKRVTSSVTFRIKVPVSQKKTKRGCFSVTTGFRRGQREGSLRPA